MKILALLVIVIGFASAQAELDVRWKHLSTQNGDIPMPNAGKEQTSATVFDIDKDGVDDFVITERTAAPAAVWYRHTAKGWDRYIIEQDPLHIEAGGTFLDVDGDGDLDFVAGGDYQSNEVWWWENPYPDFNPNTGWKRHLLKKVAARSIMTWRLATFSAMEKRNWSSGIRDRTSC